MIIILAIFGAVISAVVGTIWYSDKTPMGKLHMKYLGFDKLSKEEKHALIEKAKPDMPKMYGLQMFLSFITSLIVIFIVTMSMRNGVPFVMALGFIGMGWLAYTVPTIGSAILWSNCDRKIAFKKFLSDTLSNLVTLILIASLAGLFA